MATVKSDNARTARGAQRRGAVRRTKARSYPAERCVHQLFEAQVQAAPDAVAVVAGPRCLSYGELNARANRLGRCLRALGVQAETRVAICVERSLELVVGLLGILKAGGCYVPIDPGTPPARIERTIAEAGCEVVLCESELLAELPFLSALKHVPLDQELLARLLEQFPAGDLTAAEVGLTSRHLAYVIYTSGSTGRAKATAIQHEGILRLVHNQFFDFTAAHTMLCAASPAFDAFTFELWGALLHGKRSVLLDLSRLTFEELGTELARQRVDCAWLTASLFNQIISTAPASLASLRYLLIGGEALSVAHVRMAQAALPQTQLINGYGPTECTTFACTYRIPGAVPSEWSSIPIGSAIDHTVVQVVDEDLQPVAADGIGELLLGGPGMARGYLNNAALTAEKFVADPFGASGARLYRTGDLVRRRADGMLEFLGRRDEQVKLRGFRIELTEIEAALLRDARVRQAAVAAHTSQGATRLVAYLVVSASIEARQALQRELLGGLQHELPDYMVPAACMFLDALPLTRNGKIDRHALPPPDESAWLHAAYVAPSTERERQLTELYAENLGLARIGTQDDYFALGGDSMRAIALVSAARRRGIALSIADLFATPILADLAKSCVERSGEIDARAVAKEIAPFALLSEADLRFLDAEYEASALEDAFPLTALQQGMIFHSLHDAGVNAYHDIVTYRVAVDWDAVAFERALVHLVQQTEILRTRYRSDAGRALQVVLRRGAVRCEVFDRRELAAEAQAEQLQQWIAAEKRESVDPAVAPLRLSVHVLGAHELLLGLSFHHVLWDGWSDTRFVQDLLAAYQQHRAHGVMQPVSGAPSFKHCVALELAAAANPAHRDFWRCRLQGAELPWWSGALRGASNKVVCPVAPEISTALVALTRQLGVQEKSVWCAAYLALLGVLGGRSDVVGSTVSHARPELHGGEAMLGLFLNCLPLRVELHGRRWQDLILAVERELREQYAVRHYPLAAVQREVGLDFSASLFNYTSFQLESSAVGIRTAAGFVQTNYLLTFNVQRGDAARHVIHLDCAPVFDAELRLRLAGYVTNILAALAADVTAPLDRSALLGVEEWRRLVVDCNNTERSFAPQFVHELFEAQAERIAHAIALVHEAQHLSYAELNRRANQLAQRLRARGIGPECRVGICLPRSFEAVIAVMAVLKAGACYVPLDPEQPLERLELLARTAQLALLIARDGDGERLMSLGCEQLSVSVAAAGDCNNLATQEVGLHPQHAAYLIHTSGSTGTPKAVLVQHASLANFVQDVVATRGFDAGSRNLQFAPLVFDAATAEICNALASGSVLHLPLPATLASHESFARYVKERRINRGYIPPAFLSLLDQRDFAAYLSISVGGEAVPRHLVEEWSTVCRLTNAYGPAECTIACTVGTCTGADQLSIGTPVANVAAYVLGEDGELLPGSVPGELGIGGACLARGYANDPALTAQKFVPDPFGAPGARLYRTGDLVRRLPGGLEFVGRIDQQVKIRGFRIELGEIEAHLRQHPCVLDAAVVAYERAALGKQLAAYVVLVRNAAAEAVVSELRARAHAQLPSYMVPASMMMLDALPTTPNGKVDRKALPVPESHDTEGGNAPEGMTEELLANLWCAVLQIPRVGRESDFFALGGHSLLATQLASRIREAFGVELPIRALFEQRTLRRVAQVIGEIQGGAEECLAPIPRAPAPCASFAQERLWFLSQFMGPSAVYNIPLALRLRGALDEAALLQSLHNLVERHTSLRTRFSVCDGVPVPLVEPVGNLTLQVESVARESEVAELWRAERQHCFDLAHEQLCRLRLLRVGVGVDAVEYVLLMTLHHGVADGWSMGVLCNELVTLYTAHVQRAPSPLAPLPIEYSDYARWQRDWLQGVRLERQVGYWRTQLAGLPALLELPTDRPRPAQQTYHGAVAAFTASRELLEDLQQLSQQHGVTLFMTLLSSFAVLLGKYAGATDIAIGTPIANRTRRETEGLVGLFVNTLVLRTQLADAPRFSDLLKRTREVALQAYAHQDVPFEHLVEALNPPRSVSHAPLFQVMLALQNAPLEVTAPAGVEISGLQFAGAGTAARFDLTLSLAQSAAGLVGELEYNTDLFDATSMTGLLEDYVRLLVAVVAQPEARVSDYAFVGPAQQQRLTPHSEGRRQREQQAQLLEQVLRTHPSLARAVVLWLGSGQERQLAAYVIPRERVAATAAFAAELRRYIRAQPTSCPLPAQLEVRTTLPLRPDGTVDREVLAAPERAAADTLHVAPQGLTEQLLASLWSTVLRVAAVGREDNFFDRGGYSLLVSQLAARIREAFHVELSLRELFEHQSVRTQAALIQQALQQHTRLTPIVAVSRERPLPLSYAQQRLWFLNQLLGSNAVYNVPIALRWRGQLDDAALCQAVTALVARHEVLRTRFAMIDGSAVQIIDAPFAVSLAAEPIESERELEQLARAERQRAFDLAGDRLFRVRLLRESATSHVLLLTLHHAVCDGWSLGVLFRELVTLYRAFEHTEPAALRASALEPLAIQYADYAVWQRQHVAGALLERQLQYWRTQLADAPQLLRLPTDRPRPAEQTYRGATLSFALDKPLADELQALSRQHSATLFMTLSAAWAALLGRYAGQTDVTVGTPVSSRSRRETEGLIGFFLNTLVLRADLTGDPSFAELLGRMREVALQAYMHQDIPFEHLVEQLNPQRSLSYSPLFQVSFSLLDNPADVGSLADADLALLRFDVDNHDAVARYDITFNVRLTPQGISGAMEYNTDLFDAATIRRMQRHYEALLRAVLAAPQRKLSELDLLDAAERRQQLATWNDTARPYAQTCVHELVEQQAAAAGDSIAVVHGVEHLSYAELNRRANQLAHYLRSIGVRTESRVALCVERSPAMVVGMLGILKSGGCYVPLEPALPVARAEHMLAESAGSVVLSESHLLEELPFLSACRTVPLDPHLHALVCGGQPSSNLDARAIGLLPSQLAYVCYTSGSTGGPKGVLISHANVASLVAAESVVSVRRDDVVAQASSYAFDAITYEMWAALSNGAQLVIIDKQTLLAPVQLHELLAQRRVSVLFLTTALFNRISLEQPQSFKQLDKLLFGGEAFGADAVARALARGGQAQLLHVYGPTECTTFATTCELQLQQFTRTRVAPIGGPLANNTAYVLSGQVLVPVGAVGELCIGAAGLARGYLARPGITAEKFMPHPFATEPGSRLYRSGDLVRRLADGNLEFIGRVDHQVKLRGFRIELGEIEAALLRHPQVREAVVLVSDTGAERRLIAYVVGSQLAADAPAMLRDFLLAALPEYAVPSAYVLLAALPLTANGKLDRASLPTPDESAYARAQYVAPRTPTELVLAQVWQAVLGVEQVGIEDNFFALGGDSIRSISVVNEARARGVVFAVRDLFAHPTIVALAAVAAHATPAALTDDIAAFSLLSAEEGGFLAQQYGMGVTADVQL